MLKLPDKNTTWNYQFGLLPASLSPIIKELNNFEEEWTRDTSRQDKLATHKDTKMCGVHHLFKDDIKNYKFIKLRSI